MAVIIVAIKQPIIKPTYKPKAPSPKYLTQLIRTSRELRKFAIIKINIKEIKKMKDLVGILSVIKVPLLMYTEAR